MRHPFDNIYLISTVENPAIYKWKIDKKIRLFQDSWDFIPTQSSNTQENIKKSVENVVNNNYNYN